MLGLPSNNRTVLVVVDPQNDFCPGGALPVPGGDEIMPLVNELARYFDHTIFTQDWHAPRHASFASTHGKKPYDTIDLAYGNQVLWPDHCVQGTPGAAFCQSLDRRAAELVVRKGFRQEIDSYSAFRENDQTTPTGLAGYLRERGFERLVLCGLAFDFCVKWSALDSRQEGFATVVVEDACRAIDLEGSAAAAREEMEHAGVDLIRTGV